MKDIFEDIKLNMIIGNSKSVRNYVREAIAMDISPEEIIEKGLLQGMAEITELYKENKMFVSDLLVAVKTMDIGMNEVEKHYLTKYQIKDFTGSKGSVVLCSVEGDIHDIGKNLVGMMMKNHGLTVYDLGVDVDAKTIIDKAELYHADIICLSATLTTTMQSMKSVIERLERKRIRDKYIVMIGGGPVSENYAHHIGADIYTPDAGTAVTMAIEAIEKKYHTEQ